MSRIAARARRLQLMRIALLTFTVAACSAKPTRPDEAKFRAMTADEKCRATASRAILCTNELIVAQVRSIPGLDGGDELTSAIEEHMDDKPRLPKQERKDNIIIHKTSCVGDPHYADAVFACWSVDDCKKFASCVIANTAPPRSPAER